jgi:hypothetical protein
MKRVFFLFQNLLDSDTKPPEGIADSVKSLLESSADCEINVSYAMPRNIPGLSDTDEVYFFLYVGCQASIKFYIHHFSRWAELITPKSFRSSVKIQKVMFTLENHNLDDEGIMPRVTLDATGLTKLILITTPT